MLDVEVKWAMEATEEIEEVMNEMKAGKSSGLDRLRKLLNACFVAGVVPADWGIA